MDVALPSGEAVPAALLERFAAHFDVDLHNAYGQTETSEVALWTGRAWQAGGGTDSTTVELVGEHATVTLALLVNRATGELRQADVTL